MRVETKLPPAFGPAEIRDMIDRINEGVERAFGDEMPFPKQEPHTAKVGAAIGAIAATVLKSALYISATLAAIKYLGA